MPGWDAARHCGHPHTDALAHEIGHYLGLPHTFTHADHETVVQAEAFFKQSGRKDDLFDGDGIPDTPPDPLIRPLECERSCATVTLDGKSFMLPRRNIMSYYDERDSLSPLQIRRVRWTLRKRLEGGMALPVNSGAASAIEFEKLRVLEAKDCSTIRQPMDGFGLGNWGGGTQLFCGCGLARTGWVRLALPLKMPGRYDIVLYATLAPDFGRIAVKLDGKQIGRAVDLYAPIVIPTGPIVLGSRRLLSGDHELLIRVVGKNLNSTQYSFGVDCLELVPSLGK